MEIHNESAVENLVEDKKPKTKKESFWELVRFAVVAIAIVIPIRVFIAQPFVVSGSSMVPTFLDGQYLIIDEITYRFSEPKRDDVIVFRNPNDTKVFFIKRIIGLPNETVDLVGEDVIITNKENPEGFKLDQSFLKNNTNSELHFELKDDEYFVMGDNRPSSSDSRYWGAVPRNLITGRAFLRLLPFSKIDIMPGDYNSEK
ncbi:MAG TPA: signal peptidase I [Candidatus Paceibacterota bacterium]|nr:signal peptidase I [Candidatus Paceibacterota bacterium]HPT17891.1 signal peptidase I [Candidatus Paceibacterota bacterium]